MSEAHPAPSNPANRTAPVDVSFSELAGHAHGLATITLNRPEKLNAISKEMMDELVRITAQLRSRRDLRAVIITGAGRSFCSGLDFASVMSTPVNIFKAFTPRPWRGTNTFQEAAWGFRRLPVPVIAAVDGHCLGGGLQFALAADWRITTADASWAVLEGKWGLIPDMSGVAALSQQVGMDKAKRLAMSAETLTGTQAVSFGLASEVSEDPLTSAYELAELLARRSPDSVAQAKRVVEKTWHKGPRATFRRERLHQLPLLFAKNTAIARRALAKRINPDFGPRSL